MTNLIDPIDSIWMNSVILSLKLVTFCFEWWYFFLGSQVGVAQRDAATCDLLEKQADLINYLKDHNNKLNQKLMTLNAQLRASTGSVSGSQN